MKLANDALIEVVAIVQEGLSQLKDISKELRDLDLEENEDGVLQLTGEYLESKGRSR